MEGSSKMEDVKKLLETIEENLKTLKRNLAPLITSTREMRIAELSQMMREEGLVDDAAIAGAAESYMSVFDRCTKEQLEYWLSFFLEKQIDTSKRLDRANEAFNLEESPIMKDYYRQVVESIGKKLELWYRMYNEVERRLMEGRYRRG
jgi:hypothetical protein